VAEKSSVCLWLAAGRKVSISPTSCLNVVCISVSADHPPRRRWQVCVCERENSYRSAHVRSSQS
jgi:hypothetical protein